MSRRRFQIPLLAMSLCLVASCEADATTATTTTSLAPTTTPASAPTTAAMTTMTTEPVVWDVVALGDSYIEGLAGAYARLLAEQLGIETALHVYVDFGTVAQVNRLLPSRPGMSDQIADAEVVIVWLGYHNVLGALWGETCEPVWPEPLRSCLVAATDTMAADYDELLGTIEALVSGEAIVMIGNQALGPPEIEEWGDELFWPELRAVAYDVWAEGIAAAAAAHGAIMVDSATWLSGPEGNELLRREYLASDGLHFTAAGYEALAHLFLEADGLGD